MSGRLFKAPEQWAGEDVHALVAERLPEGQRLEYKELLQLDRDRDRVELAKDVSGMANAQGGWVIYGVAEDDSDEPRPVRVTPLGRPSRRTQVEDILDSTVIPRLDYECREIDAADGYVLLIRVRQRPAGPHMVQGYKQNRYFVRRGTRTVPMTEDEIRRAYDAEIRRRDEGQQLLAELPLLARIGRTRTIDEVRMKSRGIRVPDKWLPLVSVVAMGKVSDVDLIPAQRLRDEAAFAEPFDRYLGQNRSVTASGDYRVDAYGLVDERLWEANASPSEASPVLTRTRIYRQGVCEWAHRYAFTAGDEDAIPSTTLAEDVHNALVYFASIFEAIGYSGPLAVVVRIDDAEHAWLAVSHDLAEFPSSARAGVEFLSAFAETSVDALRDDPVPVVRDTMEVIWQAFGYRSCLLFAGDGSWRGK